MQPSQSLITFGGVNVKDLTLQELWALASVEPELEKEGNCHLPKPFQKPRGLILLGIYVYAATIL